MDTRIGVRCLQVAVFYALLGILIGISMAAQHDFSQKTLHAHANLAGWASLGLMGVIYLVLPALARTRLALAHFCLHNLGLPVLLVGVYLIHGGQPAAGEPWAQMGSMVLALAFLCFAINLWRLPRAD